MSDTTNRIRKAEKQATGIGGLVVGFIAVMLIFRKRDNKSSFTEGCDDESKSNTVERKLNYEDRHISKYRKACETKMKKKVSIILLVIMLITFFSAPVFAENEPDSDLRQSIEDIIKKQEQITRDKVEEVKQEITDLTEKAEDSAEQAQMDPDAKQVHMLLEFVIPN